MIPENVINISKKNKIEGSTFHLFYIDLNKSILFDKNFTSPIIWGANSIVMTWVKKLDQLMNVDKTHKVKIYSYVYESSNGYRRIHTYHGPIETIGKYILKI